MAWRQKHREIVKKNISENNMRENYA